MFCREKLVTGGSGSLITSFIDFQFEVEEIMRTALYEISLDFF